MEQKKFNWKFVKFGNVSNGYASQPSHTERFLICWDCIHINKGVFFLPCPKGRSWPAIPHYKWCNWGHCNVDLEASLFILLSIHVLFNFLCVMSNCISSYFVNFLTYANINILCHMLCECAFLEIELAFIFNLVMWMWTTFHFGWCIS